MRPLNRLALAAILALAATHAEAAVGFQHLSVPDPRGGSIEVGVWYPTDAAPKPGRAELYHQTVADDAPVKGERLPLVVMSHGNGGSYAGHHDTAAALAEAGFAAAALTHSGDNWRDQSRATEMSERPRQLKLLTDYMLTQWSGHARLDPDRVGAFGFSSGGFTVLVAAGATPDLARIAGHCRDHPGYFDCQLLKRTPQPAGELRATWVHDPRIRAVVAAAPALGFTFGREGLAAVRQPLQLWRATRDRVLPHPDYAEAVRIALPSPPDMELAEGADHFDFLAPCSVELAAAAPAICSGGSAFDRAAFHTDFNARVVAFFTRALARPPEAQAARP